MTIPSALRSSVKAPSSRAITHRTKNAAARPRLPEKKIQALIELYHQTSNFITHENLDARIDETFLDISSDQTSFTDYRDVEQTARISAGAQKYVDRNQGTVHFGRNFGSEFARERDLRVMHALYGTAGNLKVGLGLLEDGAELVKEQQRRDRENVQDPAS